MKLQKHGVLLFILSLLVSSLIPMQSAVAQQEKPDETERKGLIIFDFPVPVEAKVEVNLTAKLINLVTKSVSNTPEIAELIQMLDGIYVRTYDRITIDEQELVGYFQRKLKEDNWEVLVKIKDEGEVVEISLLFDEDMVYGIFAIVIPETSGEATFVNIVGEIAPERIEDLLGNLSNFGAMDIDVGDALKSQVKPVREIVPRELLAVKIENPPTIDGILDDACWKIAPEANNFTEVSSGNSVKDASIAKILYTNEAIYVGWYLYDSKPSEIVARQTLDHVRFGRTTEDWVSFSIDPFHTHRFSNRTFFQANPLGKKYVRSPKRAAKSMKWMDQWNVAANINATGWIVEMEIPWEMLDYPDTTDPIRMGINFDRGQVRTDVRSWWSNVGVEELYEKDGHWLHVLPPPKSSGTQGSLDTLEPVEPSEPTELAEPSKPSEPTEPVEPAEPVLGKTQNVSLTPVRPKVVNSSSEDIFRPVSTSTLNPVDGLRLGGGFEIGKQWHSDPLFFSGAGSTIHRNENRTTASIDIDENDSWRRYRPSAGPFLFGTMSYGFSSENLNYRAGGGVALGETSNLTYSAQIHRLTSVRDRDILLSGSEQFLRGLWGTDFQDYYLREGGVMALQWQSPNIKHSLGAFVLWEEHESLHRTMNFHLRNWSAHPDLAGRSNSTIHDGSMRSISLKYDFDNRGDTDLKYDPNNPYSGNTNEWYNTLLVEHASPTIGSDFDFTRFQLHLRHYAPIGDDQIAARLKVGTATGSLPFQRQFVIGGIGTLRGYSLYEFVGNHGFLFNLEYAHSIGNNGFIIPFVDVGQVWYRLEDIKDMQPKVNLGIGFQGGPFRLNLARALEEGRGYQVDFKWSRMF